MEMLRKTKIVCTIGPASNSSRMLERLARAGMNVARLNFSYGTHEGHAKSIRAIREVSAKSGIPLAILQDLPGPKVRTGRLEGKKIWLNEEEEFSLTAEQIIGNEQRVSVSFPTFLKDLKTGDTIFLNDGAIQLEVISTTDVDVRCKVIVGGLLTEGKGINVPGVKLSIPAITSKDLADLAFGLEQGVDFVAMSFVRESADVVWMKQFLQEQGADVPLIAKIEKHEAVKGIDAIINEADGIMVARGDLGVEIPLKKVPTVQKEIVRKCNQVGKPVIVATQMLESMIKSPRPTRAEVSDVANAIFDDADAVMLSGETAIGKYPVEAVRMMADIITEVEKTLPYQRILQEKGEQAIPETDDAISYAACQMSQQLGAACIIAYTSSGSTALRVSKYRPESPILAITPNANVAQRLIMSWGVSSYLEPELASAGDIFYEAAQLSLRAGMTKSGDLVVITAGVPMGTPGSTNLIKVQQVE
jgi:pyruvate kinase